MIDRLGVLRLGERVDGPDLLAAALESLQAASQRLELLVGRLLRSVLRARCGVLRARRGSLRDRGRGVPEALEHRVQLETGLLGAAAQALRCDLGHRHGLPRGPQLRLDVGLLRGAATELARHLLARCAVLCELLLERSDAPCDRVREAHEQLMEALRARRERLVSELAGTQRRERACAARALLLCALGLSALGPELALELRSTHRERPVRGRRAALLDQPFAAPLRLESLRMLALALAQASLCAHTLRFRIAQSSECLLRVGARVAL